MALVKNLCPAMLVILVKSRRSQYKLEAGHSTECITDAGHSIAFNKTTRRPCGTVSLSDETIATRRCRLVATLYTLCDLDLCHFDLVFIGRRGIVVELASLAILVSAVLILSCRQTDRQTESQMRMIAILMRPLSARVNIIA